MFITQVVNKMAEKLLSFFCDCTDDQEHEINILLIDWDPNELIKALNFRIGRKNAIAMNKKMGGRHSIRTERLFLAKSLVAGGQLKTQQEILEFVFTYEAQQLQRLTKMRLMQDLKTAFPSFFPIIAK